MEYVSGEIEKKQKQAENITFTIPFDSGEIIDNITFATNRTSKQSNEEIIKKGITSHSQGNIALAIKYYQHCIKQDFNDHRVFSNYGAILKELGNLKEAEVYTRKAIDIKPDYAIAYSNLGIILNDLGNIKEAEVYTRKAIEINIDYAEAHSNLGAILKDLGKFKEAELSIRKAIKLKPDFADAYLNHGIILKELGNFKESEFSILKAIEFNPHWEAYFVYASLLFDKKEFDSSLYHLHRAKGLVPKANLGTVEAAIKVISLTRTKLVNQNQLDHLKASKKLNQEERNRLILKIPVDNELISYLYSLKTNKLNETRHGDARFGEGLCSDFNLFEDKCSVIRKLETDLKQISKEALGKKEIIFDDSFFNIFTSGSGATPHNHISQQDNNFGLYLNKYSLVYYLEIGDQTGEDPGMLKLYNPDEEILPVNGMVVIINSRQFHSVSYLGSKDRVMIGVNFYCF